MAAPAPTPTPAPTADVVAPAAAAEPTPEAAAAVVSAEAPVAADTPAEPVVAEAAAPATESAPVAAAATPAEPTPASAPAAAPASTEPAAADASAAPTVVVPGWPALAPSHLLLQFHSRLAALVETAGHSKIWGVQLNSSAPDFPTLLILQKYLRSTSNDLDTAAAALGKTLAWRKEFALDGLSETDYEKEDRFKGLGYVTEVTRAGQREVVTWNVYGAVTDMKETFGDVDLFLHWRVAVMERALLRLRLATTTTPIPDFGAGEDPHRLGQVHVYSGVSFLRMDPHVKAASKATIELMGAHYPETLSRKFFVGVPLLMSWVFTAVRMFVSAATAKKFVVISYESNVAAELSDDPADLPVTYGGTAAGLAELQDLPEKKAI